MSQRTHFIRHEPCGNCGSRDNLARYSDGSAWCFGCGFFQPGKLSGWVIQTMDVEPSAEDAIELPPDYSIEYGSEAVSWAGKYGLNPLTLIRNGVYWSEYRKQLIFPWWNKDSTPNKLLAYQARNFRVGAPKYLTKGKLDEVLPIYHRAPDKKTKKLCLVEDAISAIKIANMTCDSMPCLTSTLSKEKQSRLSEMYDEIIVWLDGNMYKSALEIADSLAFLGTETQVINTIPDPKAHSYQEIYTILG